MPKACKVRFVLFVVLLWDVIFLFPPLFWNNGVFLLPARCFFYLGTVQLALLVFFAGSYTWLSVAAAAGETISEMCQA